MDNAKTTTYDGMVICAMTKLMINNGYYLFTVHELNQIVIDDDPPVGTNPSHKGI